MEKGVEGGRRKESRCIVQYAFVMLQQLMC